MTADFNTLDWVLIVVVGLSTFFGFRAGLARVIIGLAAGIAGIVLGFWFYQTPASWLSGYFKSDTVAAAIGFLIVFAAVLIAGGILARIVAAVFRWVGLTWLDRLLGAGAGFVRGMLIAIGIITPLLAFAPDPMPKFLEESKILPYAMAFGRVTVSVAPAKLHDQFVAKAEMLRSMWNGELHKVLPQVEKAEEPSAGKPKPIPVKKESF
ncbi:MAG TPA: CvpA family protein [Bryobacteraceae bacterium]